MRKQLTVSSGQDRGSDGEMNAQAIAEALHELERMIDDEKRQKNQLDKRFDDIYSQSKDSAARDAFKQSNRSKPKSNMHHLEETAEAVLSLVQKRNELMESDNIFNMLKRNSSQAAEYKAQVLNQISISRPSGDFSRRTGQRKTINPVPPVSGRLE